MAARIRKILCDEQTRSKIKTTQLIKRLQYHIFNEKDPQSGEVVRLDPSQIKAIEILLRKTLPDLSSIEGNVNVSVSHDDAVKQIENILTLEPVQHVISH